MELMTLMPQMSSTIPGCGSIFLEYIGSFVVPSYSGVVEEEGQGGRGAVGTGGTQFSPSANQLPTPSSGGRRESEKEGERGLVANNCDFGGENLIGTDFVKTQLEILARTDSTRNSRPVLLVVSLGGIKMCSINGKEVYMAHALRRINYTTCDPTFNQFAFVAREPSRPTARGKHYCHVFMTETTDQVEEINSVVGNAFRVAYLSRLRQEGKGGEALSVTDIKSLLQESRIDSDPLEREDSDSGILLSNESLRDSHTGLLPPNRHIYAALEHPLHLSADYLDPTGSRRYDSVPLIEEYERGNQIKDSSPSDSVKETDLVRRREPSVRKSDKTPRNSGSTSQSSSSPYESQNEDSVYSTEEDWDRMLATAASPHPPHLNREFTPSLTSARSSPGIHLGSRNKPSTQQLQSITKDRVSAMLERKPEPGKSIQRVPNNQMETNLNTKKRNGGSVRTVADIAPLPRSNSGSERLSSSPESLSSAKSDGRKVIIPDSKLRLESPSRSEYPDPPPLLAPRPPHNRPPKRRPKSMMNVFDKTYLGSSHPDNFHGASRLPHRAPSLQSTPMLAENGSCCGSQTSLESASRNSSLSTNMKRLDLNFSSNRNLNSTRSVSARSTLPLNSEIPSEAGFFKRLFSGRKKSTKDLFENNRSGRSQLSAKEKEAMIARLSGTNQENFGIRSSKHGSTRKRRPVSAIFSSALQKTKSQSSSINEDPRNTMKSFNLSKGDGKGGKRFDKNARRSMNLEQILRVRQPESWSTSSISEDARSCSSGNYSSRNGETRRSLHSRSEHGAGCGVRCQFKKGYSPEIDVERREYLLSINEVDESRIQNVPWYCGTLSREFVSSELADREEGAFLVRRSESQKSCFALSVRVPQTHNLYGISHYLILKTSSGYKLKGFAKEFSTVQALVTHHSVMPEQLPCRLKFVGWDPEAWVIARESQKNILGARRASDFQEEDEERIYGSLNNNNNDKTFSNS